MLNIARNASIDMLRSKSYQNSQKNQELPDNVYKGVANQAVLQNVDNIGLKKVLERAESLSTGYWWSWLISRVLRMRRSPK